MTSTSFPGFFFYVFLLRDGENLGTSTGRRENLETRLARLQVVYVVLSVKNAGLSDCTSSDSRSAFFSRFPPQKNGALFYIFFGFKALRFKVK